MFCLSEDFFVGVRRSGRKYSSHVRCQVLRVEGKSQHGGTVREEAAYSEWKLCIKLFLLVSLEPKEVSSGGFT